MTKILVTGSDGLVGYALKQVTKSKKMQDIYFASRKDADLTNFEETKKLFTCIKPDLVIHLAAEVGGIGGNMMHSGEYFRNNVLINVNVLECARIFKVKKLVSFMSTCVFPDKTEYPLKVENIHNGVPHPSNFGYAYAKRMLEVQSSAYRKEWGCNFIVLIPTNIYGENDNWSISDGHVIPSLIHKIYLAKKDRKAFHVWGSGKPLREFVYSKDIAEIILWALDKYDSEDSLILSNSKETSIRDLVKLISKTMNHNGEIIFDSDKPDGQFRKPSDSSNLKKLYPNFKFTPIEVGLTKTIEWFVQNYPKVRNYDK